MKPNAAAWLTGLVILAGCTGMKVESVAAPGVTLEGYRSYAWLPYADSVMFFRANSRILENRLIVATNRALEAKGYEEVEEDPDFFLTYQLTGEDGIQASRTFDTFGYRTPLERMIWPGGRLEVYTQGTLIIDVVSPERDLLWRGTAEGVIEDPDDRMVVEAVQEAAAKIIGKLPRAG